MTPDESSEEGRGDMEAVSLQKGGFLREVYTAATAAPPGRLKEHLQAAVGGVTALAIMQCCINNALA